MTSELKSLVSKSMIHHFNSEKVKDQAVILGELLDLLQKVSLMEQVSASVVHSGHVNIIKIKQFVYCGVNSVARDPQFLIKQ